MPLPRRSFREVPLESQGRLVVKVVAKLRYEQECKEDSPRSRTKTSCSPIQRSRSSWPSRYPSTSQTSSSKLHRDAICPFLSTLFVFQSFNQPVFLPRFSSSSSLIRPYPEPKNESTRSLQVGVSKGNAAGGGSMGAGLAEAGLTGAGFTEAGLIDDGLTEAGLTEADLTEAGLTEAGLAEAGLTEAGLTEDGLTEAGLTETGSNGAVFVRSCLQPHQLARHLAVVIKSPCLRESLMKVGIK